MVDPLLDAEELFLLPESNTPREREDRDDYARQDREARHAAEDAAASERGPRLGRERLALRLLLFLLFRLFLGLRLGCRNSDGLRLLCRAFPLASADPVLRGLGSRPGLWDRRSRAVGVQGIERVEQRERPGARGLRLLQVVARAASLLGALLAHEVVGHLAAPVDVHAGRRPRRELGERVARELAHPRLRYLEHFGERLVRAAALHDQLDDRPLLRWKLIEGGHRTAKGNLSTCRKL